MRADVGADGRPPASASLKRALAVFADLWGPVAVALFLGAAWLIGGANNAWSTQAFTALACAIGIVALLDRRVVTTVTDLAANRWLMIGLFATFGVIALQLTPIAACQGSTPIWARPDMVTIDPDFTVRGLVALSAPAVLFVIGAAHGAHKGFRVAALACLALALGVLLAQAWFDLQAQRALPDDVAGPDVARLNAAFVSANTLASIIVLGLFACAGVAVAARARAGGGRGALFAGAALLIAAALAAALFLTQSRAGWLATLVGLAALAALLARRSGVAMAALAGLGVAAALAVVLGPALGPMLGLPARELDVAGSVASRVPEWRGAWALFLDRPCLGWGAGAFALAFEPLQPAPESSLILMATTPHNWPLLILSEQGVAGLLAWTILGVGIILHVRRGRGAPGGRRALACGIAAGLVAVVAHNLVDYSLAVPAVAGLWAYLAGFAGGLGGTGRGAPGVRMSGKAAE
jgi:O-antigen ligase